MSNLPPLQYLVAFEIVARHLSFTQAAQELGMTQAGISQQIGKLEAELDCKLFKRQGRSIALTEEAEAFLPVVQDALGQLQKASRILFATSGVSRLIISAASPSFTNACLIPLLPDLYKAFPSLELSVLSPGDASMFSAEPNSLVVDYADPEQLGDNFLVFAREKLVAVASPEIAAGDWQKAPLIMYGGRRGSQLVMLEQFGLGGMAQNRVLYLGSMQYVISAAMDGVGVGVVSLPIAHRELAEGRLIPLVPKSHINGNAYGFHRENVIKLLNTNKVVLDWLLAKAKSLGWV